MASTAHGPSQAGRRQSLADGDGEGERVRDGDGDAERDGDGEADPEGFGEEEDEGDGDVVLEASGVGEGWTEGGT
jgi:hypothetical protein